MSQKTEVERIDKVKDHLANERTYLAWIRTSISIIVFGFVVAKFGVTLREFLLLQHHPVKNEGVALNVGLGFIAIGILIALVSLVRYRITMQLIESGQFKPANAIVIIVGLVTAFLGAILMGYLMLTA